MAELFIELLSEEIPSNLQKNLRENLLKSFNEFFLEKSIKFKKSSSYSTPNRLLILFEGVEKKIVLKSEEIKGPNTKSPNAALEGFVRSNGVSKKELFIMNINAIIPLKITIRLTDDPAFIITGLASSNKANNDKIPGE